MKRRTLGARLRGAWAELTGAAPERRAMYRGSEVSRLLADWIASTISPDEEMRGELRPIRARARELARNNAYVRQYLNLLTANVIGPHGFKHQALVRDASGNLDERTNTLLEEAWAAWSAGGVTVDGKLGLVAFEHLTLETTARDGEGFVRFVLGGSARHALALQGIDADLVDDTFTRLRGTREPEVRMGVEIDAVGTPVGYWIWDQYYMPGTAGRGRYRLDASEILHLGRGQRPNQTRYVSWIHPVMLPLKMLTGYTESELVAARVGAAKMGFLEWADPSVASGPDPNGAKTTIEANPGTVEELPPGLKFTPWTTDHPSTAFPNFVKAVLREIATGLGVSYNALANDLENVNYSSIRSGLLIERDLWRMLQQWWIGAFRQPVYERWLNAAVLSRELRLPTADWRRYTAARWTPRGWAWVDPLKDAQAGQLAMQNGLTSRTQLLAEQGMDYEKVLEQLAEEERLASEAGVRVRGAGAGADRGNAGDDEGAGPDGADARAARGARARRVARIGAA